MDIVAAQDNEENTILHILARSPSLPGWESIQNVMKNFEDSDFPLKKNNHSKTAFEILSTFNGVLARKLFYPSDADNNADEKGKLTSWEHKFFVWIQ